MKNAPVTRHRKAAGLFSRACVLTFLVLTIQAPATMAGITDASVVLFYSRRCKGAGCDIPSEGGVWISNYKTNSVTCIWGGPGDFTDGAYFRPDGKEVAIIDNGTLYIVNSDGTNERSYQLPHWLDDRNGWGYTTMGIVYNGEGDNVYCFDPATEKTRTLVNGSFRSGRLTVSADGLRGFETGALAEGEKGGKTFELASPTASAVKKDFGIWGHGNAISGGGDYIFMLRWQGHNVVLIYDFTKPGWKGDSKSMQGYLATFSTSENLGSGCPNWGSPKQVVNSDEYVCVPMGSQYKENGIKMGIINWRDTTDKVLLPHRGVAATGNAFVGTIDLAPTPVLKLDTNELVYNVPEGNDPAPVTVTVSNEGAGTLGQVSVQIDYKTESTGWLSAQVQGTGGNTQEISNAVTSDGVPDGEHRATVTVSQDEAQNGVTYTVILNKGAAPAAPSGLVLKNTGERMLDVSLSWKDNADSEDGYTIERRSSGGAWVVLFRTDPGQTQHIDSGLQEGGVYSYRVQAFSTAGVSAFCAEQSITVSGIPWIELTAPQANAVLSAGSQYQIAWTANLVDLVQIEISFDNGRTWEMVTELGGVGRDEQRWGSFLWTVPEMAAETIELKISDYTDHSVSARSGPLSLATSAAVTPSAAGRKPAYGAPDADVAIYSISGRRLPAGTLSARGRGDAGLGVYLIRTPAGTVPMLRPGR